MSSERPISEAPRETRKSDIEYISPEKLTSLVFAMFRFEQGDFTIGPEIATWVHLNYPKYRLNPKIIEQTRENLISRIDQRIGDNVPRERRTHFPFDLERIQSEVDERLKSLDTALKGKEQKRFTKHGVNKPANELSITEWQNYMNQVAFSIAESILRHDLFVFEYNEKKRKRPDYGMDFTKHNANPELDPYGSVLIDYAMKGKPTGSEEMDALGKDMNRVIGEYLKNPYAFGDEIYTLWTDSKADKTYHKDFSVEFGRLAEIYNSKHPGAEVENGIRKV